MGGGALSYLDDHASSLPESAAPFVSKAPTRRPAAGSPAALPHVNVPGGGVEPPRPEGPAGLSLELQ